MRRTLTLLTVFTLLIGLLAIPATALEELGTPTYTENWDGRGTDSERCDLVGQEGRPAEGWIHWIFSTKGDSTDARLTLGGTGSGTYPPGPPLVAEAWHFYTPYFDLTGLAATIYLYGGLPGDGGGLVISDYCPGTAQGEITITKTAETLYTRTHEWDIDKAVDTEFGYEHDYLPKVWLYTDGSGDETATWTVDVTYEGFDDSDWKVFGEVKIENTGALVATITSVLDQLQTLDSSTTPVTVVSYTPVLVCGVTFPYELPVGESLTCSYEQELPSALDGRNKAGAFGYFDGDMTDKFNESTGIVPFAFGDPTTEVDATVNVKDISDLFGKADLGTATAPNDAKFTYTEDFAWEDYGQEECGDHRYDNTATIVETGQEADASLLVNVQCYIFEGETATVDGLPWSDVPRAPANWFMYASHESLLAGADLIAGQHHDIGDVRLVENNGTVTLYFELTGEWELEDVGGNVKVHPMAAPTRYVQPGRFTYKFTFDSQVFDVTVPAADYYGIHLDVGRWVPDPDFGP